MKLYKIFSKLISLCFILLMSISCSRDLQVELEGGGGTTKSLAQVSIVPSQLSVDLGNVAVNSLWTRTITLNNDNSAIAKSVDLILTGKKNFYKGGSQSWSFSSL